MDSLRSRALALLPGSRRRAQRRRLAEARVRVARARGLAADMVHTDPASFEADRRQGSVLLNSVGEVADRWSARTVGWPLRTRPLLDELFAQPRSEAAQWRTPADLSDDERGEYEWARAHVRRRHPKPRAEW
jgi:hypothetical protein